MQVNWFGYLICCGLPFQNEGTCQFCSRKAVDRLHVAHSSVRLVCIGVWLELCICGSWSSSTGRNFRISRLVYVLTNTFTSMKVFNVADSVRIVLMAQGKLTVQWDNPQNSYFSVLNSNHSSNQTFRCDMQFNLWATNGIRRCNSNAFSDLRKF